MILEVQTHIYIFNRRRDIPPIKKVCVITPFTPSPFLGYFAYNLGCVSITLTDCNRLKAGCKVRCKVQNTLTTRALPYNLQRTLQLTVSTTGVCHA